MKRALQRYDRATYSADHLGGDIIGAMLALDDVTEFVKDGGVILHDLESLIASELAAHRHDPDRLDEAIAAAAANFEEHGKIFQRLSHTYDLCGIWLEGVRRMRARRAA